MSSQGHSHRTRIHCPLLPSGTCHLYLPLDALPYFLSTPLPPTHHHSTPKASPPLYVPSLPSPYPPLPVFQSSRLRIHATANRIAHSPRRQSSLISARSALLSPPLPLSRPLIDSSPRLVTSTHPLASRHSLATRHLATISSLALPLSPHLPLCVSSASRLFRPAAQQELVGSALAWPSLGFCTSGPRHLDRRQSTANQIAAFSS